MNKREGSALTGLKVVWLKEMQDYAGNIRMIVLMLLIVLTAGASMYVAAQTLRTYVGEDSFMLLNLFTIGKDPIPSFLSFISFLVPLTGIAPGYHASTASRTLGEFSHNQSSRCPAFGKASLSVPWQSCFLHYGCW